MPKILILICLVLNSKNIPVGNLYPMTTEVIAINQDLDLVACREFSGEIFTFYGAEDWEVGDICSMLMDDNGTAEIQDDVIISTRYCGYFRTYESL